MCPQGRGTRGWERSLFSQVFDVRKITLSWFENRSDLCHNIFLSGRDCSLSSIILCLPAFMPVPFFDAERMLEIEKSSWLKACGISSPWNLEKLTRKVWNRKGSRNIPWKLVFLLDFFMPPVVRSELHAAFYQIPILSGSSGASELQQPLPHF